jgi:prophage regulatory protein
MSNKLLRLPAVKGQSGLSRSTIYLRIAQGLWTHPVGLGGRAVAWPADEVDALNAARIAGKSDEQVRILVRRLEVARVDAASGTGLAG